MENDAGRRMYVTVCKDAIVVTLYVLLLQPGRDPQKRTSEHKSDVTALVICLVIKIKAFRVESCWTVILN